MRNHYRSRKQIVKYSMYGVGIAISLLPPLINAGLYHGMGEKEKAIKSLKLAVMNMLLAASTFKITTQFL